MNRRRRSDRGVTVIEAAFALPILLVFIFGLVDLGMWTFESNRATNAARDGARAGILDFRTADVGGADFDRIRQAVQSHLDNKTPPDFSVTVRCETPTGLAIPCSTASVDGDRIQVDVQWTWPLVTPMAAVVGVERGVAKGSATMALVGRPLGGSATPPPDSNPPPGSGGTCAVQTLTVDPATVPAKGSQLGSPLKITFKTNGDPACTDLSLRVIGTKNNPTTITQPCGCQTQAQQGTPDYAWTYSGSDNIWQSGRYGYVEVYNGSSKLKTVSFWVS